MRDLVEQIGFGDVKIHESHLDTLVSGEMSGKWQISPLTPEVQREAFRDGINTPDELVHYCRSKGWEPATPIHLAAFVDHYKISGTFLVSLAEASSGKATLLVCGYHSSRQERIFIQVPQEFSRNWIHPLVYDFLCMKRP